MTSTPLTKHEPLVKLIIQPASGFAKALEDQGSTVPQPIEIFALIDTGFTGGLAICQTLVQDWKLKTRNFNQVSYPRDTDGRIYSTYAWEADIAVKFLQTSKKGKNVLIDPIAVTLFEFVDEKTAQAIVGQAILQTAIFHYDGPQGYFSLEFDDKYSISTD